MNTFYHFRWYKTEKTELKGNEVIRKKCGTIFGDIYKLLEANKNCYQLEQQRRVGWVGWDRVNSFMWTENRWFKASQDNETKIIKPIMSAEWKESFQKMFVYL